MIAELWRRHRFAAGLAVALLVVGAIIFVSFRGTRDSLAASAAVAHTHEVISTLVETLAEVEAAETAQRAYVITGDERFRDESLAQRPRVDANLQHLEHLVSDNREQLARAQLLRSTLNWSGPGICVWPWPRSSVSSSARWRRGRPTASKRRAT